MIPVQEILYQTIQGEGFYTGSVCDFVRLYGCPVGCFFCDTGYAKGETPPPFTTLDFTELNLTSNHVVISGGEPMIHKKLPSLCRYLLRQKKFVSIETSGAFWQPVPDDVWITLSPKEHLNPKMKVAPNIWKRADELKFVFGKPDDIHYYEVKHKNRLKKKFLKYLQPEWGDHNEMTLSNTLDYLRYEPQYKLSLQTHKLIGIP
tara:strand:+ start:218 stop:829 length:612 start_codon:yes stop_codon:yes gene_type:complete